MYRPATDEEIAALQAEIRRAARETANSPPASALAFVISAFFLLGQFGLGSVLGLVGSLLFLGLAGLAGLLVGPALTFWYRSVQRRALGQQLAQFAAEDRAAILLPLKQDERGEARTLAAGLIHDLGVPTALIPADAPAARGDELSPTRARLS